MNLHPTRFALLCGLLAAPLSAQTVLSDFTGPDADGWTGSINGVTTFPNGFTAASGVTFNGEDVLNLSDGGFGAGAVRVYSGLPTTGFVTFSVLGRIDTDPGTLNPDPNSNPGSFGTAFGLAAGSVGLEDQAFGYTRSLSTPGDDSGQAFAQYAVTVRADGSGDFTAFFTPEQHDHAVGGGTWVAQLDDVTHVDCFGAPTVLSDFASGIDGWTSITASNSPFGSSFATITQSGGELVVGDGGFTGGAFSTYVGAAPSAGIHNVYVDLRIVTDNLSLDRARIAVCAGGATTDFSALSFSQSFSTTGDDSGQAMQTVAVPVITTGPDDITVYLLSDYDAAIGSGAWEIRIDEIRVQTAPAASTSFSTVCGAGHHSLGGPTLDFTGLPTLGSTLQVDGGNLGGTPLTLLLVGDEVAPVSLTTIGSLPGSQACVSYFASIAAGGATSTSVAIPIPNANIYCGLEFAVQFIDFDPAGLSSVPLPLGTSRTGRFTIGL